MKLKVSSAFNDYKNSFLNTKAVLKEIKDKNLCFESKRKGKLLHTGLELLKQKFPTCSVAVLLSISKSWSSIDKKGFELKKFIIPKSISD